MTKNELVVLGLLSEQPMHGYQLYHQIEKSNMETWAQANLASIYNTLERLRRVGMVQAKKEKPGKMPEREVYHITSKGKKRLSNLVEEAITDQRMPENSFCVAVAFLFGLPKKRALECLEEKKKNLKKVREHLESLRKDFHRQLPLNWRFLLRYGIDHLRLDIKKIEDLKGKISKLKGRSSDLAHLRLDSNKVEDLTRRVSKLKSWS
ncbi:MAG: PadR family transcriptional regulator [Candidatus Zixiibacteriota bacterium]